MGLGDRRVSRPDTRAGWTGHEDGRRIDTDAQGAQEERHPQLYPAP